jgi:hypothetical protein
MKKPEVKVSGKMLQINLPAIIAPGINSKNKTAKKLP